MLDFLRNCTLDIVDFDGNKVCPLYDTYLDVQNIATGISVTTQRNGWKTITFTINSSDKELMENFVVDYIKPEYRIRIIEYKNTTTGSGSQASDTDYFILDKPKISHNNYNKTITVTASHCSAILKYRRLDLEFSDEKLNNTGTAEELLITILEGTGWSVGDVSQFYEKYDKTAVKKRSLKASKGTGAFNLIAKMCDLFEAKPVYHGDTKTVDILPLNPFSKDTIDPNTGLPDLSKAKNVIELYYSHNVKNISKTQNSENIVTKLYCYGSYGDTTKGYCSIYALEHLEYTATATTAGNYYIVISNPFDTSQKYINFTAINPGELTFSCKDRTSMCYIYNEDEDEIYRTEISGTYSGTELTTTSQSVQNWTEYLLDFTYYIEEGLLTDDQLFQIAQYQRNYVDLVKQNYRANLQFNNDWSLVYNYIGGVDFVKLDIDHAAVESGNTVLYLTDDKVIYRTDYDEVEANYFDWYTAKSLKNNGLALNDEASVIYVVHSSVTTGETYTRTYIRAMEDKKLVLWKDVDYASTDDVYLFQANCTSGKIGGLECGAFDNINEISYYPAQTDIGNHPVYFGEIDGTPESAKLDNFTEYGWYIVPHATDGVDSDIYFCYKTKGDTGWQPSLITASTTAPSTSSYDYYYNLNETKLYHAVSGSWELFYDENASATEEWSRRKAIKEKFAQLKIYIDSHERAWKGYYEQYIYTAPTDGLTAGNYYYQDPYNNGFLFTTTKDLAAGDTLTIELGTSSGTVNTIIPTYYSGTYTDILDGVTWTAGSVDNCGIVIDESTTQEITSKLATNQDMLYNVSQPCTLTWYNSSDIFVKQQKIDVAQSIIAPSNSAKLIVTRTKGVSMTMTTNGTNGDRISPAVVKLYDSTIKRHAANILADVSWFSGKISSTGTEVDDTNYQRTTWLDAYENTWYKYTDVESVYFYTSKSTYLSSATVSGGYFKTPAQTCYIRFVRPATTTSSTSCVLNYNQYVIYAKSTYNKKQYKNLTGWNPSGELLGLYYLIQKFRTSADACYITDRERLATLEDEMNYEEKQLTLSLGEIYKETTWQDTSYIEGHEKELFFDAIERLDEASHPQISYEIGYQDLYNTDLDESVHYPDIDINSALHILDDELNENLWAFVEQLTKCYDQPWNTSITVNTNLTTVANQTFTDVMTTFADVTAAVKASEGIVDSVAEVTSGKQLIADMIAGTIDAAKAEFNGAASSWYTDDRGNIIFEAANGSSAMKLCGNGFCVANKKDEFGDWMWSTFGNGDGFTADLITGGTIRGNLIEAGSITTDLVSSTFGNQLEIGSNKGLLLFATVDGTRPAGSVDSKRDGVSYIQITPDGIEVWGGSSLNLESGSAVTVKGSDINISGENSTTILSGGNMDINAVGDLNILGENVNIGSDTQTASINIKAAGVIKAETTDGSYTQIDQNGVEVKGRTIKLLNNSSTNGQIILGDEKNVFYSSGLLSLNDGSLLIDGSATGNGSITTQGNVNIAAGGNISLSTDTSAINMTAGSINMSGGTINATGGTITANGAAVDIKATSSLDIASPNFNVVSSTGAVEVGGTIYAKAGQIGCTITNDGSNTTYTGGWYITSNAIYSGTASSDNYIELNSNNSSKNNWAIKVGGGDDPTSTSATNKAEFAVRRDGTTVISKLQRYKDEEQTTLETIDLRTSLWKMDHAYLHCIPTATSGKTALAITEDATTGQYTLTLTDNGGNAYSVNFTSGAGKTPTSFKFVGGTESGGATPFDIALYNSSGALVTTLSGATVSETLRYASSGIYEGNIVGKAWAIGNGTEATATLAKPITMPVSTTIHAHVDFDGVEIIGYDLTNTTPAYDTTDKKVWTRIYLGSAGSARATELIEIPVEIPLNMADDNVTLSVNNLTVATYQLLNTDPTYSATNKVIETRINVGTAGAQRATKLLQIDPLIALDAASSTTITKQGSEASGLATLEVLSTKHQFSGKTVYSRSSTADYKIGSGIESINVRLATSTPVTPGTMYGFGTGHTVAAYNLRNDIKYTVGNATTAQGTVADADSVDLATTEYTMSSGYLRGEAATKSVSVTPISGSGYTLLPGYITVGTGWTPAEVTPISGDGYTMVKGYLRGAARYSHKCGTVAACGSTSYTVFNQTDPESGTVYHCVNASAGTVLYQKLSTTYYGSTSQCYLINTTSTSAAGTYYLGGSEVSYTTTTGLSGTTLYEAGTTNYYAKVGSTSQVYKRGNDGNAVYYSTTDPGEKVYKAGTAVSHYPTTDTLYVGGDLKMYCSSHAATSVPGKLYEKSTDTTTYCKVADKYNAGTATVYPVTRADGGAVSGGEQLYTSSASNVNLAPASSMTVGDVLYEQDTSTEIITLPSGYKDKSVATVKDTTQWMCNTGKSEASYLYEKGDEIHEAVDGGWHLVEVSAGETGTTMFYEKDEEKSGDYYPAPASGVLYQEGTSATVYESTDQLYKLKS